MKVVHIIGGGDVGGAKTHVLYLLREMGRHIGVRLISLRPGVFAEDARAMGIDVTVIKSRNIFSDIKKVAGIINEGGYDIIHSHGAKANIFALAARRYVKLPTVTTVHSDYKLDYMHSIYRRWSIGLANSIALRFVGNYIAVSRSFRDMLISRSFKPEDIFVLYNGMDFSAPAVEYSREKLLEKYGVRLESDDLIVGIAARLYPVKSIDTIVRAARLVKDRNKKVKFLLGGDGEDRKQLEALSKALGLTDTVYFLGWMDDPNELMSSVDISVLTSISESFPYSILEGARFKKATISSNVGGIPDLIEDGKNGCLFEAGDYQRFAGLILELASDEKKRTEMGEKLYEKAFSEFSVESMARTQLDIYGRILGKPVRNRAEKLYDTIISGYYGFQNIGDDAMLMSIINDLRKYKPDIKMLVLSKIPTGTTRDYNVDSISRVNIIKIFRAMRNARAFIYGGGNLLQDNTSTRSLLFYLGMVWLAKNMKLKVMFYANGIGPLQKKINRSLTRKIMNKVDLITLREELSYSEIKHMDITKPRILVTADSALTVIDRRETASYGSIPGLHENDAGIPMLGISLRKYPGHEKFEHERYECVIARLADHMAETYGLLPVFIPMQHPDDLPILENAAAKMKYKSLIIREKLNVFQTYGVISRMSMLVGMRLHALIFAAGAGVPMLGLVYDPKIQGFLEYVNQASAGDVRLLDCEKLIAAAEDVWKCRDEIKERLERDVEVLKRKASENARVAVELIAPGEADRARK